tara:strand:+ start:886 stop:2184 length:1299 start_codon:yes stop_codon:yes gene_type:complete
MKNWIYYFIAFLLAIDNVFVSKRIGFLSFDRLFEIIIFAYFIKQFINEFKTNKFFKRFCQFVLICIFLKLFMNVRFLIIGELFTELQVKKIYTDLFKGFTFIVYPYLFLIVLNKGLKYVRVICWFHLIIVIFALLHHPLSPVSSQVSEIKKTILTSNDSEHIQFNASGNEDIYIKQGLANRFRLSGPFAYAIPFSYFAFSSFILAFFMFIKTHKKFYLILLGLLLLCAFLSQTRSLILAFIVIIGGYVYLKKEKNIKYKFSIYAASLVALIPLIIIMSSISVESRVTQGGTSHAQDNRPLLWLAGVLAVMENPLGVTKEGYDEMKYYVYSEYDGDQGVLELPSHNGIVNIGFNYTFFGYFVFLIFIIYLLRNASLAPPNLKLFFRLTFTGYLIHTSFHNNFILFADYPILMMPILIGYESEKYFNHIENIKI